MQRPPLDPDVDVADTAPTDAVLTPYDREHVITYLRLLDADAEDADWREAADDDDDDDEVAPPPGYVEPPAAWEKPSVAKKVQSILDSLEIPKIDAEARNKLQRWVHRADRHGDRGDILLTLRAIAESEGNGPDAILDPILRAVHSGRRPEWQKRGLSFIEAFDSIDLRSLLRQMIEPQTLHQVRAQHLSRDRHSEPALGDLRSRRVARTAEEAVGWTFHCSTEGVTERSDVLALRKRKPRRETRAA